MDRVLPSVCILFLDKNFRSGCSIVKERYCYNENLEQYNENGCPYNDTKIKDACSNYNIIYIYIYILIYNIN